MDRIEKKKNLRRLLPRVFIGAIIGGSVASSPLSVSWITRRGIVGLIESVICSIVGASIVTAIVWFFIRKEE